MSMSDIELVIKIPEEIYHKTIAGIYEGEENDSLIIDTFTYAIANGTPLPKGHGRLIEQPTDADIAETIGGQNDFAECIRDSVKAVFDNAQTIIEEDKAESEDKE